MPPSFSVHKMDCARCAQTSSRLKEEVKHKLVKCTHDQISTFEEHARVLKEGHGATGQAFGRPS